MRPLRWDLGEAQTRCAAGVADLDVGVAREVPALIVECDDRAPTGIEALRSLPAVVVGIGPGAEANPDAFDLTGRHEAVVAAATAHPNAAVTLAQVLRQRGSIEDGLALESFAYASLQSGPEFSRWLSTQGRRVRRPDPSPPVLVDEHDGVVELTLNRPRLRNALSAELRDALVEALRSVATRPVDVVLRATGPAFSVGGDLAEFGTVADPSTAHQLRSSANAAPWFAQLAHRLTVEVHGATVGAGIELAAFAGRVRAKPDAVFALPEVAMGLIPGAGGTVSIPRRIGAHATLRWALENTTLTADEALDLGLIDEIVS